MYSRPCLVLLAMVLLVGAGGCQTQEFVNQRHFLVYGATRESETEVLDLDVWQQLEEVEVSLDCSASRGACSWVLTDSNGAVLWEGRSESDLEESETFDAVPGIWKLEWVTEEFSGSYALSLMARGGTRVDVDVEVTDVQRTDAHGDSSPPP